MTHDMRHMAFLETVAANDVAVLRRKEATYQGSWKREGGRSAWFMLRRKIDRLLVLMARPETPDAFNFERLDDALRDGASTPSDIAGYLLNCYAAENVFAMIRRAPRGEDGSTLAEIRDLRRYLMLVEAEMLARDIVESETVSCRLEERPPVNGTSRSGRGGSGGAGGAEPNWPGTPEDGGHHAAACETVGRTGAAEYSEFVDPDAECARRAREEHAEVAHPLEPFEIYGPKMTPELAKFYHRRTRNVWRLEESLPGNAVLPAHIAGMYFMVWPAPPKRVPQHTWILDRRTLREVPNTLPRFALEMNDVEMATMPHPYQMLYGRGADDKWHLKPQYVELWGVAA